VDGTGNGIIKSARNFVYFVTHDPGT